MRPLCSSLAGIVVWGLMGCGGTEATSSTSSGGADAGPPPPSCKAPASPAVFEIGTGDSCFERLTAGQTVPVNDGPQGGYHVWMAVGCSDCGNKAVLEFGTKDPATKAWLNKMPSSVVVDLTGTDWKQYAGLTAFLPGDEFGNGTKLPKGSHVLLSLRVLSGQTEVHAGEIEVVLGDDQTSSCSNASNCGQDGLAPCCGGNNNGL